MRNMSIFLPFLGEGALLNFILFRSTSKAKSDLSVKDIVEQDVKNNPVMMYIKWIPEMHICGFSALAVRVLKEYLVTFERLKKHQKGRLVHGHRQ
ncbi:monothiol glutaredoxin-S15, mitochondrial isoform X3 [Spinacia oleracea]|uniref:Monothiol glutaredoxin-S15, mitochondrial isoform X3 n=1 Tax=Spinacia oleracea TaxID=3562 RepID=A0ABM3RC63_SPIOL|nr:monothiol glutaredoxin-S15, mitochondrial-like isoform X3 [Spinacia oleracea]